MLESLISSLRDKERDKLMGLGDIVNSIYKKYKDKYLSRQQAWEQFKSDSVIEALNKYVDYPLYSNNLADFIEKLNKLNYDEASEMVLKLSFLNTHEMMEFHYQLCKFLEDD